MSGESVPVQVGGSSSSGLDVVPPPPIPPPGLERPPRDVERVRREQPHVRDRVVGVAANDWTSFDVNRSMRILRTGTPAQICQELLKLHLRWWHATRVQMERIRHAAGVPNEVST